jgi:predicted RNase H-like HicB family nuclease
MRKHHYVVRYERDDDGWWVVTIDGKPGGVNCVTQGRSLKQARSRIREALALCLDDAKAAKEASLEEHIEIGRAVQTRLKRLADKRERLEKLRIEASHETREAAKILTEQGLSMRDAAELLGVSFQRVQQLLDAG